MRSHRENIFDCIITVGKNLVSDKLKSVSDLISPRPYLDRGHFHEFRLSKQALRGALFKSPPDLTRERTYRSALRPEKAEIELNMRKESPIDGDKLVITFELMFGNAAPPKPSGDESNLCRVIGNEDLMTTLFDDRSGKKFVRRFIETLVESQYLRISDKEILG